MTLWIAPIALILFFAVIAWRFHHEDKITQDIREQQLAPECELPRVTTTIEAHRHYIGI